MAPPLAFGTVSECVAMGRLLEQDRAKALKEVQGRMISISKRIATARKAGLPTEELEQERRALSAGPRREFIADQIGMNPTAYARARRLIESAEREPERYGDLVTQMDKDGRVAFAYAEFERRAGIPRKPKRHVSQSQHTNPMMYRAQHQKDAEMMDRATRTLEGVCMGLKLVDHASLDKVKLSIWVAAITEAWIFLKDYNKELMKQYDEI